MDASDRLQSTSQYPQSFHPILGDSHMPLAELMSQIQELPKIDKLRLMQFLATELVKEEDANFFVANQEYPIWSPYNCSEAANVLMDLLATKQQEMNG
jgi:hypothetical protein